MMDAVQHGDVIWQGEFRYRRADGSYADVLDRGSILRDPAGKPLRFVGIMQDVSEQKAREARHELLVREQAHRTNNILAVVNGIVQQTRARATDLDSFVEAVSARIFAMANANSAIVKSKWAGADFNELAKMQLEPYLDGQRVTVDGPVVLLSIDVAQPLALALNELATNSTKYGAMSVPDGSVELRWRNERRGAG
jgi:two-component sensor histidine kinase